MTIGAHLVAVLRYYRTLNRSFSIVAVLRLISALLHWVLVYGAVSSPYRVPGIGMGILICIYYWRGFERF